MKSLFKFLILGAMIFSVSHVMAEAPMHKAEISKHCFDLQPAVLDAQEMIIERVDFEVLTIPSKDEALQEVIRKVPAVANAPPKSKKHVKAFSLARSW